jgi:hypothetical protein
MMVDREDSCMPSSAAPPYLLARMDMLAVLPPEQPPADPYLVGSDLATQLNTIADLVPDAHPTLYYTDAVAATASTSTQFHPQLGVSLLLTVVVHKGRSYVCTSVDDASNIVFGQAQYFMYAIRCYAEDSSPAWTMSLALWELIKGGPCHERSLRHCSVQRMHLETHQVHLARP